MSRTSTSSPRRGRSVLQAVLLAGLLGAVALVVAGVVPGSGRRLGHAALGWIAVELIAEAAAVIAYALLFHGVFSSGAYRLGYVRAAQIGVGELGAFVVVPTGAGGPALRIWALMRCGMTFSVVMTRSVIHAAIFNLPYIGTAIVLGTTVVLGLGPGHAPVGVALAPLGVVAVAVSIALAATRFAHARRAPPRMRWRRIARDVIQAVPDGLRELPGRLREPVLLPAAVGYWAGDCGVLIIAFHAAHGSAPVGVIVLAYMLGQLGNALPLPGGVGGIEPIMLGVLTASGVKVGLGGAAIILYRFVSLGFQAAAGAVAVVTLTASFRRASADAAATPA